MLIIFKNEESCKILGLGFTLKTQDKGISLVFQWLRIHLPMQEMRVRSLVRDVRSHMTQGN